MYIANLDVLLRRVVRKWKMGKKKKEVVPDSNKSSELYCTAAYGSALKRKPCNDISSGDPKKQ